MSRFSDFGFPQEYPEYPDHHLMAEWFRNYAERFDLLPHIRFNERVLRASPIGGEFEVETESGVSLFDSVVVASGNLWDPVTPSYPGKFDGQTIHAQAYRDSTKPLNLAGKSVLVVGLGNSGCEIAVELSEVCDVTVSARSGQLIIPRVKPGDRMPPHPASPLSFPVNKLPVFIRDRFFRFMLPKVMRKIAGQFPAPESVGLAKLPTDPFEKRSVVNDNFLPYLAEGRMIAKPNIKLLGGNEVEFVDGSRQTFDVLIYATGYQLKIPYLSSQTMGVVDPADLSLYQGIMHPVHKKLFVVGIVRALCSIWPMAEQQSKWVAALLSGKFKLPLDHVIRHQAYPVCQVPLSNCQFRASDLRREAGLH